MKIRDITVSAILIALTIIILYLNLLLPISTLSILTLASLLVPIALIKSSIKSAFSVYIISSIIGFFILPINIISLYASFFGIYGIIKYYIEKINKFYLEIILKLIFFNIILVISFFVFNSVLAIGSISLPIWLFFLVAQPIFFIFDYALTLLISFYIQKIHNKI